MAWKNARCSLLVAAALSLLTPLAVPYLAAQARETLPMKWFTTKMDDVPGDNTVDAVKLAIPAKAQRELEKGNRATEKGDLETGRRHFLKAIELFPKFSNAYNNLGVVALLKADLGEADERFGQALRINPRDRYALINIAKVRLAQHNAKAAEQFALQYLAGSPTSDPGLVVLALAQLKLGEFDDTVETCRRIEGEPHAGFAYVHVIASAAYELKGHPEKSIEELREYLNEGGSGDSKHDSEVRLHIKKLQEKVLPAGDVYDF